MTTKLDLMDFEASVARRYLAGEIPGPVHLSGGNEDQLLEIFESIDPADMVFSTWRNHYHALLHGVPRAEVTRQILAGKSMTMNWPDPFFYASSIAGGIIPIALGAALAVRRRGEPRHVWAFVGDMAAETGAFYEAVKYAGYFNLPVKFVVEDNGMSVLTPTEEAWGGRGGIVEILHGAGCVLKYSYKLPWPHHGAGEHKPF